MATLPKYTNAKHKGNIGEAIVQYLLSSFSLVHKIDGSNDVGNDFICELIKEQHPTNLLFYVQVKLSKTKPRIKSTTLEYWKSSPLPVFVFWIKPIELNPQIGNPIPFTHIDFSRAKKSYLRMTPVVHGRRHKEEKFHEYLEAKFKRDLIVDYARVQYKQGFTPIIEPRAFLSMEEKDQIGFPRYNIFIQDVIPEYKEEVLRGSWINLYSTALLLYKEGGHKNLKQALELLMLTEKLGQRDERYTAFNGQVQDDIGIIKMTLENLI